MDTIFELQSFRCCGSTYELVGEATRGERRVTFNIPVEGEIYQEIRRCVNLDDGSRYRLSLQCKWDPFRQRYFSSVTRIKQNKRKLLYFPCSPAYRDSLLRLHDISFTSHPKPTRSVSHPFKAAMQICIVGCFFAVCILFLNYDFNSINRTIAPNNWVVSAAQQPAVADTNEEPPLEQLDGAGASQDFASPETTQDLASPQTPEEGNDALLGSDDDASDDEEESGSAVLETGVLVKSLPEGYVALTFDDGPSPYTREIVDILREHQVDATFFFIGVHALKYPNAVKYASDNNMVVGNHSWSHRSLIGRGPEIIRDEIAKTNDYLSSITDAPVTVFRPPFGHVNDQLINIVTDEQMKVILWNRDPRDWRVNNSKDILDYFYRIDSSGGIYVLHENELTVRALPEIIQHLKQNDLQFTVLQ